MWVPSLLGPHGKGEILRAHEMGGGSAWLAQHPSLIQPPVYPLAKYGHTRDSAKPGNCPLTPAMIAELLANEMFIALSP